MSQPSDGNIVCIPGVPVTCPGCGLVRVFRYRRKSITGWCRSCRVMVPSHRTKIFDGLKRVVDKRKQVQASRVTATCRACGIEQPNTTEFFQFRPTTGLLMYGQCRSCKNKKALNRRSVPEHRVSTREKARVKLALLRQEMFDHLGHSCSCCGETEKIFLGIEHLKGGGREHRRGAGSGFLRSIQLEGWPRDKYAVLCHNCNLGKYLNGGTLCPHIGIRERLNIPFAIDGIDMEKGIVMLRQLDPGAVGLVQ